MNTRILETLEFSKIKKGFEPYLQTEMGLVELNQLSPLSQVTKIQQAFSEIEDMASIFVEQHHFAIGHTKDITDTLRRLELGGDLNISEMIDLKRVLTVTSELGRFYQTLDNVQLSELKRLFEALEAFPSLQGALQAINDAGFIEDFASPELSSIRRQINTNEHHIRQTLQDILKKNSDYLVEQLVANRNGRSVLPVKNSYRNRLSGVVHDISSSGNTVYIEPRAIISLNEENTQLKADERHEIKRILKELSQMIAPHTLAIRNNLWIIGHLDLIRAKYFYMTEKKGAIPKLASDKTIQLLGARHPLLSNPIPNDLHFPDALTAIVITGPNTGGKTIMLKTLGVTQLMGQSGLPILADKGSKIAVFSEIFADIGDEQSIEQSLSTFSSHMTHTVDILKTANQDSLILFDELGAGTDPQEGASLAISILDFLRNAKIKTMATTHYPELKAYGIETPNVENASMAFDIDTLSPTYHFMQGVPGRSNAFEIAKRLGLFESIVTAAEQLTDRDSDVNSLIEKLENQTLESKIRLNHIKEVEQENVKFNRAVKKLYNEFSHAKDKEIEKATQEAREIVELALKESDSILKNLHTRAAVKPHEIIEAKGQLKKLIPDTSLSQNKVLKRAKKHRQPLVGDDIIVIAYGQRGTLIKSLKERTWEAQVGLIKMTLSEDEFQLVKTSENKSKVSQKSLPVIKKSGPSSPRARLDLRGMRYEEAITELDSFIDQALVNNLSQVDIIHGIGTGVIREAVTKYLRQHRHIKNFAYAPQNAGGSGCTIATLK